MKRLRTVHPKRMAPSEVLADYRSGRRNFMQVDISGADLSDCDLKGASFYCGDLSHVNFSGASLTHVQLKGADVRHANLAGAQLNATDLIGADFSDSNLAHADLTGAALYRAKLIRADLTDTNLGSAGLSDADLTDTRLKRAHLHHTILCDLDVTAFCDEAELEHTGPSYIDYRTVVKSHHHPGFRQFMNDCGVPGLFAEFMIDCARASNMDLLRQLMQSTFITYGGPDEKVARKLYDELRARGVVTFFFPQTATVGARLGDEVFHGIQEHDRILLICSRRSLDRPGVVNEIQETFDREARDGGASYLLPITLDDYVFKGWRTKQPVLSERVGRRVIGDFRGALRNKEKFEAALNRLVNALKKKRPRGGESSSGLNSF